MLSDIYPTITCQTLLCVGPIAKWVADHRGPALKELTEGCMSQARGGDFVIPAVRGANEVLAVRREHLF